MPVAYSATDSKGVTPPTGDETSFPPYETESENLWNIYPKYSPEFGLGYSEREGGGHE